MTHALADLAHLGDGRPAALHTLDHVFLLLEHAPWLAGIPALFGIFEAFVHMVGIKVHSLKRLYPSGMATVLSWPLPALICIIAFAMQEAPVWQWLPTAICYLAIFVVMEVNVRRAFGVSPKDVLTNMRMMTAGMRGGNSCLELSLVT